METPTPEASGGAPKQPASRRLILLGALAALLAGAAGAWWLSRAGREAERQPPAATGGLVIDTAAADRPIDLAQPLRCFVEGQFVGDLTLAACAQRNGVATNAMDVGLDASGALAASEPAPTPAPEPSAETGGEPPVEPAGEPPVSVDR